MHLTYLRSEILCFLSNYICSYVPSWHRGGEESIIFWESAGRSGVMTHFLRGRKPRMLVKINVSAYKQVFRKSLWQCSKRQCQKHNWQRGRWDDSAVRDLSKLQGQQFIAFGTPLKYMKLVITLTTQPTPPRPTMAAVEGRMRTLVGAREICFGHYVTQVG